MKRLGFLLVGLALAPTACSSPCGEIQSADNQCGTAFNQSACSNDIGQCTSSDDQTISTAASCVEDTSVCANGAIVNNTKYLACILPLTTLSSTCKPFS